MGKRVTLKIEGPPVFDDNGVPKGKGRPRASARIVDSPEGPRAIVSLHTPKDTVLAEKAIAAAFRRAHPHHKAWTGPVMLRFTAGFQTPRSFNKALKAAAARGELMATRKPDKDNIEKLIVDALNKIAYVDDAQVIGGGIKRYGSPARIEISLESLASPDVPTLPGDKRAQRRQQETLPLGLDRPGERHAVKSRSDAEVLAASPRKEPDLTGWSPRQRELIKAAMARDERAKQARKK